MTFPTHVHVIYYPWPDKTTATESTKVGYVYGLTTTWTSCRCFAEKQKVGGVSRNPLRYLSYTMWITLAPGPGLGKATCSRVFSLDSRRRAAPRHTHDVTELQCVRVRCIRIYVRSWRSIESSLVPRARVRVGSVWADRD